MAGTPHLPYARLLRVESGAKLLFPSPPPSPKTHRAPEGEVASQRRAAAPPLAARDALADCLPLRLPAADDDDSTGITYMPNPSPNPSPNPDP